VEILHPKKNTGTAEWNGRGLRVRLPETPTAVLLRLTVA
jgi:alpha-galactosidase